MTSARDLRRIEAVRQSFLYQHLGETLAGPVSIRAYCHTKWFAQENNRLIDGFNEPNSLRWASKEWLTSQIASLGAVISCLTGTLLLLGLDKGSVTPGVAGLALTCRSRVLVLDEATASIDHATGVLIQSPLHSIITANTTVVTIFHHLSSIVDYNKVVVLEAGCVMQHGPVAELLSRSGENAFFRHLCG